MANCVLCGQKLGMFDKVKIDFHNTKQSVCSDCANRLDNTVGPERAELFRQILDSPYLENGEDIRADINTGKPCPACGAILHRKLRNFSIGSDGTDGPTDAAGGIADGETAQLIRQKGVDAVQLLNDNDAYHALDAVGGLIKTGATGTNVNDVSVLLLRAAE